MKWFCNKIATHQVIAPQTSAHI